MLGKLTDLLGGGILETLRKGVGMFTGDRAARESGYHDESMASRAQFATEFQVKNRTKLDSVIDGINRLPRPVIVCMVIYYFVTAVRDQPEFQKINLALDTVPDSMWQIAFAIIAFYFLAREFHHSRKNKMAMSPKDFDEHVRRINALDTTDDMTDVSKPLSDAAIKAWNDAQRK